VNIGTVGVAPPERVGKEVVETLGLEEASGEGVGEGDSRGLKLSLALPEWVTVGLGEREVVGLGRTVGGVKGVREGRGDVD